MTAHVHKFGDITLSSGEILPDAKLSYVMHGKLDVNRGNAILFPTWFGSTHRNNDWIIGPGRALDTNRYCILVVDNPGNGLSSSPSNTVMPPGVDYPLVSVLDAVKLMHRLLVDHLAINTLQLIIGRSMGAQIALQWASYFPDMVRRLVILAGSGTTSRHCRLFLDNLRMVLTSTLRMPRFDYDRDSPAINERLKLFFDAWGLSQAFYRNETYKALGFNEFEAYLERPAVNLGHPIDLLAQVETWRAADISANNCYRGNALAAYAAISARTIMLPSASDFYFPPADNAWEAAMMANAELRVINSVWGHRTAAPGTDPLDINMLEKAIEDCLKHTA